MNSKPTYKELVHQIDELKKELEILRNANAISKHNMQEYSNIYTLAPEKTLNGSQPFMQKDKTLTTGKNLTFEFTGVELDTFNDILDTLPLCIALIDMKLEYIYINTSYANSFNLQKKELIGKKVDEILSSAEFEQAYDNMNKAFDGQTITYENTPKFINGVHKIRQTTYTPYYKENRIEGIIVYSSDISEIRKTEQALINSDEKFKLLIKNSNDIIVLVNEKGEQYYISDVAEKLTGYTNEELIGSIENVIYPDDVDIVRQHWNRVLTDKNKPDCIQYRHKHKEKGYIWLEAVAQNFINNPAIQSIVANIRDVTERKNAEQALIESEEAKKQLLLMEINRINSELHKHSKLAAIANLKLLQSSGREEKARKKLEEIEKSINIDDRQTLNTLIADFNNTSYGSNWNEFELLFEKVHNSFYEKLHIRFPNLTPNERKICAFLKLNMRSKDIAQITFQSEEALTKARVRLRKKLGLTRDVNMVSFLQNI